ncbi:thiolase family protein [Pseudogemmobacter sonorensis]|uniref:thiolase family protein n=1 Tax=Pseudogemmobacter sonorensis TaxID=2989681 RepID=UPI0036C79CBB
MKRIVLSAGKRTPFGDYGRSLKDVPMVRLGQIAAEAAIADSAIPAAALDHLVWGNVMPVDQEGFLASRVIALNSGLPEASAAINVSRACSSGTQAIVTAAEQILSGHGSLALAGGGENFSRAPYWVNGARWGLKRGPGTMVDALDLAYRDPFSLELMGETAENLADDFGYGREAMDGWALMSQQRAGAAIQSGFLARQIVPVEVPERRGTRLFDMDEFPRPDINAEKLAKLPAVFREGGRVTPGNSSGVTDGAGFVVVGEEEAFRKAGGTPAGVLVDWAVVGVSPRIMGCGPVPAIQRLLQRQNLTVRDIDYWEINEAFASVNLHAEAQLGLSRERTNLYGGGISLGHPPGATGVRMAITAMQHLRDTGQKRAVVSMCMGAGQGMAVLIEAP